MKRVPSLDTAVLPPRPLLPPSSLSLCVSRYVSNVESNVLKINFCYHILSFKISVEIDSKSIQVCNLLIINGSSEMTPEIQTILNLLCGSAVCCKEEVTPVDGHVGDHVDCRMALWRDHP